MFMTWTFNNSERMFKMVEQYADVMEQVGLFNFTVDGNGVISGQVPQRMFTVIPRYPNVNWLLTIQNYNTSTAIVNALLNNTDGARTMFFSELERLVETYPWCAGIDIDLERCGGLENQQPMKKLIADIYEWCHARDKILNLCVPPITGPNNSVGGEYWCAYEDYATTVDTMTIMSYAFAWLGSSPGPVSPKWWLEEILDYATVAMPKDKLLLGIGAWALMWGLHQPYPGYKATSGTYYWPVQWMQGKNTFHDFRNGEGVTWPDRQPHIPFAAYWNDYEKVCYMMPHVYDYVNGDMCDKKKDPLVYGIQDGRRYIVGFTKFPTVEGEYKTITKVSNPYGAYKRGSGYIMANRIKPMSEEDEERIMAIINEIDPETGEDGYKKLTAADKAKYDKAQPGTWEYEFTIKEEDEGYYVLALDMNFPWFDSNALKIVLDGEDYSKYEYRFWNLTFRSRHKEVFYEGYLEAGTHVVQCGAYFGDDVDSIDEDDYVAVQSGVTGAIVYGLCIGREDFTVGLTAGEASYTMSMQEFVDVDGNIAKPADNYAVTIETLRTPPDSANIWYDDFRGYSRYGGTQLTDFWNVEGTYNIVPREDGNLNDAQKVKLTGECKLRRTYWRDVHVYARWDGGSGRVGVTFGGLFACINYSNNQLQLWNGGSLIHAEPIIISGNQAIAMRVRRGSVRVYTGTNKQLRFTVKLYIGKGSPGFKCTRENVFTLCRVGSGWWYEPYECFELTVCGQTTRLGRVEREGVTWDYDLQVFRVNEDVNEPETRTEDLSLDYDFQYLGRMPILWGKEYTDIPVVYKPIDINIRHMRTYIGDADGFGIMYYEDADVLQYWYNRTMFEYGIKGMCMWSLGQEDCRIWERIGRREEN